MRLDHHHEQPFECTECGQTIIVGGMLDGLDPRTYRGVVCGCRRQKKRQPDPRAGDLAATIARAREAQAAH